MEILFVMLHEKMLECIQLLPYQEIKCGTSPGLQANKSKTILKGQFPTSRNILLKVWVKLKNFCAFLFAKIIEKRRSGARNRTLSTISDVYSRWTLFFNIKEEQAFHQLSSFASLITSQKKDRNSGISKCNQPKDPFTLFGAANFPASSQ